jgi:lysozyme
VKRSGVAFAFIKATEGGDRVDDRFKEYWRQAKRAGIPRGAYHFYYFCRPAIEQARWFIRHVPRERGMLPPVLDMEWNHLSPTCKLSGHLRPRCARRCGSSSMRWSATTASGRSSTRHRTSTSRNIAGHFRDETFWLRTVKAHPRVAYPGRNWTFWQYTGTGVVPGVAATPTSTSLPAARIRLAKWVAVTASDIPDFPIGVPRP